MADRNRFGSLSLGLRIIRRQISTQPAIVFSLLAAVAVSSILLSATPRLLERVSVDDLGATVSDPHPANRNISVDRAGRISPGTQEDPMLRVRAFGESFADRDIPPAVRGIISDSYFLMTSPQFTVTPLLGEDPPHPHTIFLRLRHQERIEDEMTLLSGRLPELQEPIPMLAGPACPEDLELRQQVFDVLIDAEEPLTDQEGNVVDCRIDDVSHYEIAVTAETAEIMGLEIGRQMLMRPDSTDPLFFGLPLDDLDYVLVVSISGIVNLSDSDLEYWYGDSDLHRPRLRENADFRIIFATGLINPSVYADMVRDFGAASTRYTFRHFVSPGLVQKADLDTLIPELRDFENRFSSVATRPNDPRVTTQLSRLLNEHVEQRDETIAVMSTTVATLFAVTVAVILVMAVLMTARQRNSLVLIRNRGASTGQLGLTRIYQGIVLVVPAGVLGYLLAAATLPDTEDLLSYRIAVGLASTAIVMIIAAAWPLLTTPLGELQRDNSINRRNPTRRVVVEIFFITLAFGTIVLLRRRGQIQDNVEIVSFDWLLASAPTVLGVTMGLVAVRLFPLALNVMAWFGSKLRGLVGFIGFKRVIRRSSGPMLTTLVIMICVSAAVFALVARSSVEEGQQVSSYQSVGADFSVRGHTAHVNLPTSVNLSEVDSIEASALGTSFGNGRLVLDASDLPTQVLALDASDYSTVISGLPRVVELPSFLTDVPQPDEGTADRPIPAIVSTDWPASYSPRVGDVVTIDLGRLKPVVEVRQLRNTFPDLADDRPFVVFNRSALVALSDLPVVPTVQYLKASESTGDAIAATLEDQSFSAVLTSRYELLDTFEVDPFVSWVDRGLFVLFVFAGVLALVTVVSALALASAQRRIDLGYLKTLGLTTRQATALTVIEQLPGVLVATVVGSFSGVAVAMVLDPAIDYDAFTGQLVPTAVAVHWGTVALLAGMIFAALTAAIVIFVIVNRGEELGQTIKLGDE